MDRDHKIRILTSKLRGKAREVAVLEFCKDPMKLDAAMSKWMYMLYRLELKK